VEGINRPVPAQTPSGVDLVVPGNAVALPGASTQPTAEASLAPQVVPSATPGATLAPTTTPTAAATESSDSSTEAASTGAQQTPFEVASVTAGSACSSDTIGGQVLDADGRPVDGVRIIGVDQWGNFVDALTGESGETGAFSVPIGSDAREYYMTVVDANGAPLSFTVTVEHRLEGAPQNRCHTIVWRARTSAAQP
jgi:hypothetical protein